MWKFLGPLAFLLATTFIFVVFTTDSMLKRTTKSLFLKEFTMPLPDVRKDFGHTKRAILHQEENKNNVQLQMSYSIAPFLFPEIYRCPAEMQPNSTLSKRGELFHFSQAREDRWLYDNIFSKLPFEERFGGTFLEIGALDGRRFSNTLYFEKKWDWRGILVEGHPSNSPKLRANRRQNCAIFTAAVCNLSDDGTPGTVLFTKRGTAVGAVLEDASPKFLQKWHNGGRNGAIYTSHPSGTTQMSFSLRRDEKPSLHRKPAPPPTPGRPRAGGPRALSRKPRARALARCAYANPPPSPSGSGPARRVHPPPGHGGRGRPARPQPPLARRRGRRADGAAHAGPPRHQRPGGRTPTRIPPVTRTDLRRAGKTEARSSRRHGATAGSIPGALKCRQCAAMAGSDFKRQTGSLFSLRFA